MRHEIEVNEAATLFQVRIFGRLEVSEYEPAILTLLDHPKMRLGIPVVYDLRGADIGHLTATDFEQFASVNARLAPRRGRARVAIVVNRDFAFGLARMYEVLGASPNLEVHVFRDHAAACEWAALPPGPADTAAPFPP